MCSGAAEQSVSQWASTFAEQGLGITKTMGDLCGPMAFAILMGTSRLIYGKYGEKLDLDRFMKASCLLCIASYACIALAGDLGCSGGPTVVGFVSSCLSNNLRAGIMAAVIFPILLLLGVSMAKKES